MYRRFFQEWLPANPDAGTEQKEYTRKPFILTAIATFKWLTTPKATATARH